MRSTKCDPKQAGPLGQISPFVYGRTHELQPPNGPVHSCCSHGMPSPSPSISIPGQFSRNRLASLHEVIWSPLQNPSNPHEHWAFGVIADGRNSRFYFQ